MAEIRQTNSAIIVEFKPNDRVLETNAAIIVESRDAVTYVKESNAAIVVESKSVNHIRESNGAIVVEYEVRTFAIPNNSSQGQTSENVTLTFYSPPLSLSINNTTSIHISDNINLINNYELTIDNSQQIHSTSENITLYQNYILLVNNSSQSQISENLNLTQHEGLAYVLDISNSYHLQTTENISLTQHYILYVNNSIHNHSGENIFLGQKYILTIDNSTHLQDISNIILYVYYSLIVENSYQLHFSENVNIIYNSPIIVINSSHLHTSEKTTLTQHYSLLINNVSHIHASENIVLIQNYLLFINNSSHTHISENILLPQYSTLTVSDSFHIQTSENIIFRGFIDSAIHYHTSDKVNLTQKYVLSVNNSSHIHTSNNITITTTPTLLSKVGSFNIDSTKTAGQTQSITGIGFSPKVVLFWWSGSTNTSNSVSGGNINIGFGAATDSSNRFSVGSLDIDGLGTSDNIHWSYDNGIVITWKDTGTTNEGTLDFTSMDSDGFTVHYDKQFTYNYRISYMALGGGELTNVKVGSGQFNTSSGNKAYTGVGFKPDALIFASTLGNLGNYGTNLFMILGMATDSTHQGVTAIRAVDNQGTSSTQGYGYNGESVTSVQSLGNTYYRQSLVSMDSDGFTLNMTDPFSGWYFFYIALKGGSYTVSSINTRTDGNDITATTGFLPKAILFSSTMRALSTVDVSTADASISIGAATSVTNRASQAIWDEDSIGIIETSYANYDDAVYINVADDSVVGLMDIKSTSNSGFIAVMDTPDVSENWITFLAIGERNRLTVQNSTQVHTAENTILITSIIILRPHNCTHLQITENIRITTNIVIIIAKNSTHLHTANTINLIYGVSVSNIFGYRKISFGIGKKRPGL